MRRCDFRFGSGSVDVSFESANVQPGLECLVLSFRTSMSATWLAAANDTGFTPMLVTGRLTTAPHELRTIGEVATQVIMLRGTPAQEHFEVTITADQALAIEARRKDADPLFYLRLFGTLVGQLPEPMTFPSSTIELSLEVPTSTWLTGLDDNGYMFGLTVRVPEPLGRPLGVSALATDETVASRAQATSRLRQARNDLVDGRYEDCVATCRKAIETLMMLHPQPAIKELAQVTARSRTEAERWAMLHHDLHSLTSAAHHDDETTAEFRWNRGDAEAVLAIAASLCARSFNFN
jgi:hypothetical protein